MKLTKEDVSKLSNLARLEISDDEQELFSHQLSDVLDYAGKLSEAKTENVEMTSQVTGLTNVFREDVAEKCLDSDQILANSPDILDSQIKVRSILNKD